jgi:hypothetical protein
MLVSPDTAQIGAADIADLAKGKALTSQRLKDPAQVAALCEAIVDHGSVGKAIAALGLVRSEVFLALSKDEALRKQVWEARAVLAEMLWTECIEIADEASQDSTVDAKGRIRPNWDNINRSKLRIETRMRVAGKMLPRIYGELPSTQVNVQNNIGLVCDEETRARLIELRERLLLSDRPKAGPNALDEAPPRWPPVAPGGRGRAQERDSGAEAQITEPPQKQ